MFHQCKKCNKVWSFREDFMEDARARLTGLKVDFSKPEESVFYCEHVKDECNETLPINAIDLKSLYEGGFSEESKNDSEENLESCEIECKFLWVRNIIGLLKERGK